MGVGVLYRLRLVNDDSTPFHLRELAVVADDERIARHHDIGFRSRLLEAASDMAHVSLVDIDAQGRRELRKLVPPVRKQRKRRNDKNGLCRACRFRGEGAENPRNRLDRLAEAHVVGK